ncbi:hypothetical protein [Legionella spiritensis]|uniref:Dot/Icm system substrate protein LidA n=1 Tax=Legionella spiritensis TaxID=452 RepID=A0A0W0Z6X1_LEGSP|nr:hypothetical protein [Legionella spiritensis]KTD64869.1 Dot/Icm system substrate protein LidA [Legionella spiritensis]SNV41008.1 Dot/Icm system substrate protein LidA [Legionella spiritensis]
MPAKTPNTSEQQKPSSPTDTEAHAARQSSEEKITFDLKTTEGKQVSLTSRQLESWFASIERQNLQGNKKNTLAPNPDLQHEQNDPYLAAQFIGRYGIKSSKDIITFLKSPAGKATKTLIGEQLAELAAMKDFQRQQYQTAAIRRHNLLAFLLMGLLYNRIAKAKHAREILREMDAELEKSRSSQEKSTASSTKESKNPYSELLASYEASHNEVQNKLSDKLLESEQLEQDIIALENQGDNIDLRYDTFEDHLGQLDDYLQLADTDHPGLDKQIDELEQQIQALQKQLSSSETGPEARLAITGSEATGEHSPISREHPRDVEKKISRLQERAAFLKERQSSYSPKERRQLIESRLKQLEEQLDKQVTEIDSLIEQGRDEEAMKRLHEHNGLHIQAAGLKDMLDVVKDPEEKGKKILFNSEGKQVHSFKDADFIVANDKKIVKGEDGKFYLLGASQDINSMEQEDRLKAQKEFEKVRPEISSLKNLVQRNKTLEKTFHTERMQTITGQSDNLQKEILDLSNQLTQLQAAQASVANKISQLDNPSANPNMTPLPSTPTPTPSMAKIPRVTPPESYRHVLNLLRHNPNPSPEIVNQLKGALSSTATMSNEAFMKELNKIRPGMPGSDLAMQNMLKNLERFGKESRKPNVAPPTGLDLDRAASPLRTTPLSKPR